MTSTDIRAGGSPAAEPRLRPARTLTTVALVQFLVSLDLAIVNVALPQIGAGLGFGPGGLTWVINAYALAFGGLLLLGGKAADRYGRRRVLLCGLGLFGLASLPAVWPRCRPNSWSPAPRRGSAPRRSRRPCCRC